MVVLLLGAGDKDYAFYMLFPLVLVTTGEDSCILFPQSLMILGTYGEPVLQLFE
jgi:hypothetical protein